MSNGGALKTSEFITFQRRYMGSKFEVFDGKYVALYQRD